MIDNKGEESVAGTKYRRNTIFRASLPGNEGGVAKDKVELKSVEQIAA